MPFSYIIALPTYSIEASIKDRIGRLKEKKQQLVPTQLQDQQQESQSATLARDLCSYFATTVISLLTLKNKEPNWSFNEKKIPLWKVIYETNPI